MYGLQGNFSQAESLFEKAVTMLESLHPEGHPAILNVKLKLAWILSKQNKFDKSLEILTKSNQTRDQQLHKDWPDIVKTLQELADINSKLAKFDQVSYTIVAKNNLKGRAL
jgi:tetratricopeptide (TPR) repeat protein